MRVSDSRYARERTQFELAMRMIAYEARTCTIRSCTGLSDDRIRKIYTTYFKSEPRLNVRRQRGKPPTRISIYVKTALHQSESTTLALLFCEAGLILDMLNAPSHALVSRTTVAFGQRFCLVYDMYCLLHPARRICFERAWYLLAALISGDELQFTQCVACQNVFVHDSLSLQDGHCPGCRLDRRKRGSPKSAATDGSA